METVCIKTEGKAKSKMGRRCEEWLEEDGGDQLETKDAGEETTERNNWASQNSQRVVEVKEKEVLGPTKENQTWRIRNNEELDKLIKHGNIANHIKAQRLSWFGHIQRMPEAKAAKKIFKWNPLTTRPRGRPNYRWKDNIIQDLGQMKIKNWITCVQDRAKWKDVVEKAKTSN